jgi:hypothetical protein
MQAYLPPEIKLLQAYHYIQRWATQGKRIVHKQQEDIAPERRLIILGEHIEDD